MNTYRIQPLLVASLILTLCARLSAIETEENVPGQQELAKPYLPVDSAKIKEPEPLMIEDDPKLMQLFWSGIQCSALEHIQSSYREMKIQNHYSKIGGVANYERRYILQAVIKNNDRLLANVRQILLSSNVHLMSCSHPQVKTLVKCQRKWNLSRFEDVEEREKKLDAACSDSWINPLLSKMDSETEKLTNSRYLSISRHQKERSESQTTVLRKTQSYNVPIDNNPKLVQLVWSSLYCGAKQSIASSHLEMKQEKVYSKIGGVTDYKLLYQLQETIRLSDQMIAKVKSVARTSKLHVLSCQNPEVQKIIECYLNSRFDDDEFDECVEQPTPSIVSKMLSIQEEMQFGGGSEP